MKNIKQRSWMRWLVFLAGLEIIAISIFFMDRLILQLVAQRVFLF